MASPTDVAQQAETDAPISLYTLDTSALGGGILRFTSGTLNDQAVEWQGNLYTPVPVETSGWEWNGRGALPQPTVRLANVNHALTPIVNQYDDLVGLPFTRTRTFKRFLDGELDADPDAHWPIDVYVVEQKTIQNKLFIEWRLSAQMDQQGLLLPRRQILQNACTHTYRRWTGAGFDYTKASCPYTDSRYFLRTGQATGDPSLDMCGKKLSDCKKHFPSSPLPTRAFPGVARVRG